MQADHSSVDLLSRLLVATLPDRARVVVADQVPIDFELLPAEVNATIGMIETRRREFTTGRYCARTALAALGATADAVPKASSREPVWPPGIVGSISHCDRLAAAAVGHAANFAGIGIDLERDEPLKSDLIAMICRPEERVWLSGHRDSGRLAKMLFSAKESIYKCIWPEVRRFVDFQDVAVAIDAERGTFEAVSHSNSLPQRTLVDLKGHQFARDGLLFSSAFRPSR